MASTREQKSETPSSGEGICHAHRLRDVLRDSTKQRLVDEAAAPLINAMYVPLLRLCDGLIRGTRGRVGAGGEDLAQEAWRKTIAYLTGDGGDRIKDDVHFERILRCTAKNSLLDWIAAADRNMTISLDQPMFVDETAQWAERIADKSPTPEDLLFPKDGNYLRLIEILFMEPDRFHKRFRQLNQRHPRQYQAYVLYQMALLYREAAEYPPDEGQMDLVTHFVSLMGVSPRKWETVSAAARQDAQTVLPSADNLYERIIGAVNETCGTQIRQRKTLTTYRAELNRFVGHLATFREEIT